MMATSTPHPQASPYHKDKASVLSLSLTTSQHSMQMIAAGVCGLINPTKQPLRARAKGLWSWYWISRQSIGGDWRMILSVWNLFVDCDMFWQFHISVMLMLYSRLARIKMAGSQLMICLIRSIVQLMSSRGKQMALPLGSSCLTMHPVTKSGPPMHCQHKTWPSGQTSTGLMSKTGPRCNQVHLSPGWLKNSITWTPIQQCPTGSKGWKQSSEREVYGQLLDSKPSAKASNVYQATPNAAAANCYSTSPTSWLRSRIHHFTRSHMWYIYPKTTASWTLLRCTGVQLNTTIAQNQRLPISMLWRQMFLHALMMSHYCKSNSKHETLLFSLLLADRHSYRYANHSSQFISAYIQGLSGADAAWVNKKYHRHRTLPPDMVKVAKNHVHQ